MEKVKEFKNALLKRLELQIRIQGSGNPGFEGAKEIIVKDLGVKPEVVVVNNVRSHFGSNQFLIEALVYDSEEQKNLIEPKKKEKKK